MSAFVCIIFSCDVFVISFFLFFLNPTGDCSAHSDTPIVSPCPGGKDHGVEGGHQVNSPIESSPISVAPPAGM